MAGSADFKSELSASDMFDQRLRAIILKIVDVSYGGDNGFNQAIELSAEVLQNVKFIQEKKLISTFFEEIAQDTSKYCFGVDDTLKCLDLGAVHTLIIWENLEMTRYQFKNPAGGGVFKSFSISQSLIIVTADVVKYLTKEHEKDTDNFKDDATNADLEIIESISLVEWFANNYRRFGATLEFVTNRSQEGSQFCRGFGGIGGNLVVAFSEPQIYFIPGILRYKVDLVALNDYDNEEVAYGSSDEDI